MIANQSNVAILGSRFEKNHAGVGGAIYSTVGSQIHIQNSTFTENNVCLLQYQNEYLVCFGGVLFCENKNSLVEVINSDFTNNLGDFGGVFALFDQCTISINSSRFIGNLAIQNSGNGGVLYLQDGITASIYNSLFFDNNASSAGGAVHAEHSFLKIYNSEILKPASQYTQWINTTSCTSLNYTVYSNQSVSFLSRAFRGGGGGGGGGLPPPPPNFLFSPPKICCNIILYII